MLWPNVEEIARSLNEHYPTEDVEDISLEELQEYIESLPNFEDDGDRSTTNILERIQEAWQKLKEDS